MLLVVRVLGACHVQFKETDRRFTGRDAVNRYLEQDASKHSQRLISFTPDQSITNPLILHHTHEVIRFLFLSCCLI